MKPASTSSPFESDVRAAFARLAENYWIVNVTTPDGVTGGQGPTQREALASVRLSPAEIDYLMDPDHHTIQPTPK